MTTPEVKQYWNEEKTESMYDRTLLGVEVSLIKERLQPGWSVLDAGCGEGISTLYYTQVPNVEIIAADNSPTRLEMAKKNLEGKNILFGLCDFIDESYGISVDCVISQRMIINLPNWEAQKKALRNLVKSVKAGGSLLLCEGSRQGARELNAVRKCFGLPPIEERWHNVFLEDAELIRFVTDDLGLRLVEEVGMGSYLLLTRGIQPALVNRFDWASEFNTLSATPEMRDALNLGSNFSRIKLWNFKK